MFTRLLAASAALLVLAAPSSAAPVALVGEGELGSFTGLFDFRPEASKLSISLTNTSPAVNGGYITGFVFNFDSPFSLSLDAASAGGFEFVSNEPASPFGTFQYGAALGGNFLGGGKAQDGIGVGRRGRSTSRCLRRSRRSLPPAWRAWLGRATFWCGSAVSRTGARTRRRGR